jgi:4-amino-4-deoxychorismate lyase
MNTAPVVRCWIDGEPGASVDAADRGLHYGDGLFETLRVEAGRVRWLARHLARLERGAARLSIALPPAELLADELAGAAAGRTRALLKLIVTRGSMQRRGYRPSGTERTRRILTAHDWPADDGAPLRLIRSRIVLGTSPALAGLKHLNRLENVLAQREAAQRGADEALLAGRQGESICGSMSNLIVCTEEGMLTPALDQAGVEGVMRSLALDAAAALGVSLPVVRVDAALWPRVQAVYCCNVRWGLRRAGELDGQPLGNAPPLAELQRWIDAQP